MDKRDFVDPSTGHLVLTPDRHHAFVPAALPPQLDMAALAVPMANAMGAVGELRGACRRLPNPYILIRPLQRREALTSSAMEGTFSTDENLLLAEAGLGAATDESTQEVLNYVEALHDAIKALETLPISRRLICQAHATLLQKLSIGRGANKRPGEYKSSQNWIGGLTIDRARFVPPPPQEALNCMDTLEKYINRENPAFPPAIIDLALVHYQIEAIHPFNDGNGRIGRMLVSLMAINSGLLEHPVLYMSPSFETDKNRYIDLMYNVSTKGEWTEWIAYFCDRIIDTCQATIETIDRLLALQSEYRRIAGGSSRSSAVITLVDHLFTRPFITVTDAMTCLKVTYPAAKKTIDKLVEVGILSEYVGAYPKLFYAPAILRVSLPTAPRNGTEDAAP